MVPAPLGQASLVQRTGIPTVPGEEPAGSNHGTEWNRHPYPALPLRCGASAATFSFSFPAAEPHHGPHRS